MIQAEFVPTFEGWRDAARDFIKNGTPPSHIHWLQDTSGILKLVPKGEVVAKPCAKPVVPAEFLKLAEWVCYSHSLNRFSLLYRLLFRLQQEGRELLQIVTDPDVLQANALAKSVKRDVHKMHAFVRFKKVLVQTEASAAQEQRYMAWHRPDHPCLRLGAPFFTRRFGDRAWSIFTPEESAHWDKAKLIFGVGMPQVDFNIEDQWDEVWKTYYKSIFNPARVKIRAMKLEMAPKYWSTLPEASLIPELIRSAPARVQVMAEEQVRAATVDESWSIEELRSKASACQACPLAASATQTVFGIGPSPSELMIVGEQPGEQEDILGQPFVGPAGEILNQALEQAGLKREALYLTNAIKHFKWTPQGKHRRHKTASGAESQACRPWLEAEISKVRPRVIVALGVTAGTAVMGKRPTIAKERGQVWRELKTAPCVLVSWHPSAILRTSDPKDKEILFTQLVMDLKLAKAQLESVSLASP